MTNGPADNEYDEDRARLMYCAGLLRAVDFEAFTRRAADDPLMRELVDAGQALKKAGAAVYERNAAEMRKARG